MNKSIYRQIRRILYRDLFHSYDKWVVKIKQKDIISIMNIIEKFGFPIVLKFNILDLDFGNRTINTSKNFKNNIIEIKFDIIKDKIIVNNIEELKMKCKKYRNERWLNIEFISSSWYYRKNHKIKLKEINAMKNIQYTKSNIITKDFMEFLINNLCFSNNKAYQRTLLAMFILYCTGLHMSTLLSLTIKDLMELTTFDRLSVPLSKFNNPKINVYLIKNQRDELLRYRLKNAMKICVENKYPDDKLFTTNSGKPISYNQLRINIKKRLVFANKNIYDNKLSLSVHSFRIGFNRNNLKQTPIAEVASMVDHKDINSDVIFKAMGIKEDSRNILKKEKQSLMLLYIYFVIVSLIIIYILFFIK